MNPQGPPLHYPSRKESTADIYQPQSSSTSSVNGPPAYDTTPPIYPSHPEKKSSLLNINKTAAIRLASSVFVAVLVCIIVAAIIGRIESVQAREASKEAQEKLGERLIVMAR
jgi:hypothetical protein